MGNASHAGGSVAPLPDCAPTSMPWRSKLESVRGNPRTAPTDAAAEHQSTPNQPISQGGATACLWAFSATELPRRAPNRWRQCRLPLRQRKPRPSTQDNQTTGERRGGYQSTNQPTQAKAATATDQPAASFPAKVPGPAEEARWLPRERAPKLAIPPRTRAAGEAEQPKGKEIDESTKPRMGMSTALENLPPRTKA